MHYIQAFDWDSLPRRRADVLVIGGGMAGLTTALEISKDRSVLLVGKTDWQGGSTAHAQGGVAVALAPGDRPEEHLADTLLAGAGLSEPEAVRVLVEEGPGILAELLAAGLPFDRQGGRPAFTREGAHRRARVLHAGGDATGRVLAEYLAAQASRAPSLFCTRGQALDLLRDEDGVFGALVYSEDRLWAYLAEAVVLATGGAGQLYRYTTNPPEITGDGIAMAYRAGATLADLEFVQFHPTALALPGQRERFLVSEAVRGEGAVLKDSTGRPFMAAYHPQADLGPRDVVAKAIYLEMERSGSDHVSLDATSLGKRWPERFPTIFAACLEAGIDPRREPIPVAPAAHFFDGGIRTDLHGRTDLPGLWAVGEAAAAGLHGANRLASNSLLEGLVFGRRAARDIAGALLREPGNRRPLPDDGDAKPPPVERTALQDLMWRRVGILRDEEGLLLAAAGIARLPHGTNTGTDAWENMNLACLGGLLAEAARRRRESRGNHQRSDYPAPDPEARHLLVSKDGGWREVASLWS